MGYEALVFSVTALHRQTSLISLLTIFTHMEINSSPGDSHDNKGQLVTICGGIEYASGLLHLPFRDGPLEKGILKIILTLSSNQNLKLALDIVEIFAGHIRHCKCSELYSRSNFRFLTHCVEICEH